MWKEFKRDEQKERKKIEKTKIEREKKKYYLNISFNLLLLNERV